MRRELPGLLLAVALAASLILVLLDAAPHLPGYPYSEGCPSSERNEDRAPGAVGSSSAGLVLVFTNSRSLDYWSAPSHHCVPSFDGY